MREVVGGRKSMLDSGVERAACTQDRKTVITVNQCYLKLCHRRQTLRV
jgi:hypothetical protein